VSADRSTENGWLRKLEKAADEHQPGDPYRTFVFRQILQAAWNDGRERGYDDCHDDVQEAERVARKAARQAAEVTLAAHQATLSAQSDEQGCPHCPDGHQSPTGGSQPWSAWVAPERDADGQPMQITVARSAGAHVAESDAQWVRERLNAPAEPSIRGLPLDHPLRRQCRCSEAGVCRMCSERPSANAAGGQR
jgi:hypothetical protein